MSGFPFLPDDEIESFEEGLLEYLQEMDAKLDETRDEEEETIINQVA